MLAETGTPFTCIWFEPWSVPTILFHPSTRLSNITEKDTIVASTPIPSWFFLHDHLHMAVKCMEALSSLFFWKSDNLIQKFEFLQCP
jgi:hypothetical protein